MRHQDLENDAQHELRRIVRSIDKRLQHQVLDGPSGQDPLLILTLSRGQSQASMELSVEEVRRALEGDRERYLLRERIKRTNERLWFRPPRQPFFSTKAIRPGSESFANMR